MPDPAPNTCQHCSKPLPPNPTSNTCPACLIAEALNPLDSVDDSLSSPHDTSLAPSPDPSQTDPLEGTTLGPAGRYKILQRIGEGGFGTVFMAEQTAPVRRRVAIKILKPGMDTRQVVARFEAERQALAMMDHPNIAKVLDGGETDRGRPYFVMELVRGTPITTFCDREKLDTRQRLDLFLKVCRAVQHAHQKGIIHRDLKPANILVTVQEGAQPVPKVIDFGVAKAMEATLTDKTLFTRFEQMVGTPAYMSPEQAGTDAAANDIDTRADIYALGVLLYELLTGSTPFESATLHNAAFDEIRRILREEDAPRPSARLSSLEASRRQTLADSRNSPSPQSLDKLLRGDLDWIVMKAIEKDRRRRYETANALALDLDRFLNDDPVEARPPSTTYRLQKFARRHKTALATAATILLILVAATTISTIAAFQATDANHRASKNYDDLQSAYTDLDSSRQETERQRNEALWNQYVAKQFPIRQAWQQRNFGHLERLLDELVPKPGRPDFRGWEWTYFRDQCDQAFTTIKGRFPTWNPNDGNLAVVRDLEEGGSAIVLVSPIDGSLIRTIAETPRDKENRIYNLRWSADGGRIAYLTYDGRAVVLEASSGNSVFSRNVPTPKPEFSGSSGFMEVRGLDLNHDGTVLVTGTWAGNIQLWDVNTNQPRKLLQAADNNSHIHAHALRFDPRFETLAGALRFGRRTTWNLETGEAFEYVRRSLTASGTVAWKSSSNRFAVTDTEVDSVAIYQLNHPEPLATLHHRAATGVSWIGDKRIATLGSDQVVRIWDTSSFEQVITYNVVAEPDSYEWSPVSDPAGKLLAIPIEDGVKIIKLGNPVTSPTVLAPETPLLGGKRHRIEWDQEDQHVASWHEVMIEHDDWETKLRIWDTRSRSQISVHEMAILAGIGWKPDKFAIRAVEKSGSRLLEVDPQSGEIIDLGKFIRPDLGKMGPPAFSPDGRWLVLAFGEGAVCLDANTLERIASWAHPELSNYSLRTRWHSDGRSVALMYWDAIVIWSPFGERAPVSRKLPAELRSQTWSPDGRLFAVGHQNGRCTVLDATSLNDVAGLSGHRGPVVGLDWSTNGRIASASGDGTVRIWDDATGDELLVLQHPEDRKFLSVRWTHDGRRLAAGDDQGRIFIWGSTDMQPRPTGATGLTTGTIAR